MNALDSLDLILIWSADAVEEADEEGLGKSEKEALAGINNLIAEAKVTMAHHDLRGYWRALQTILAAVRDAPGFPEDLLAFLIDEVG